MNKKSLIYATVITVISLVLLVLWQMFKSGMSYYVSAVIILLLSLVPFLVSFEIKDISSADITLTATLIALATVSRAAFYLVPQVKPIAAVVIVSAICLGAERGFIIGSFSAFVSNFIFGQGYWTPFQMVALGLVGLVAGLVIKNKNTPSWKIALIGFFLTGVLYGLIVDLSTILVVYGNNITLKGIVSTYAAAIPFNITFGLSTAVFLFVFSKPFISKIQRINTKYGIIG